MTEGGGPALDPALRRRMFGMVAVVDVLTGAVLVAVGLATDDRLLLLLGIVFGVGATATMLYMRSRIGGDPARAASAYGTITATRPDDGGGLRVTLDVMPLTGAPYPATIVIPPQDVRMDALEEGATLPLRVGRGPSQVMLDRDRYLAEAGHSTV